MFEPNGTHLRVQVQQAVALFLRAPWRAGALFGSKEEEASFVNVGCDTTTEDDIVDGRQIIEIGIAAVRPAAFVISRVLQTTPGARS